MKKALSLILVFAMLFCLATTAFAAENVVGDRGKTGGYTDGVDSFTTEDSEYKVNIDVTLAKTVHKYAVDVEYNTAALSLGGSTLTWDVNTMTYVTTTAGSDPSTTTKEIKINNYSDLPVQAYATINKVDNADGLNVTATSDINNKLQIAKATPGTGESNGSATTGTITITLSAATTWADVVEHYTNKGETGTITVATATIVIEPVSTTP